jgi:hypothetical protein
MIDRKGAKIAKKILITGRATPAKKYMQAFISSFASFAPLRSIFLPLSVFSATSAPLRFRL